MPIGIGVTFVSALLLPGLLALAVGLVASCLIVYMLSLVSACAPRHAGLTGRV